MSTLLCFGLGYSAEHYASRFGARFDRIVGTVRSPERAAALSGRAGGRLRVLAFDGTSATPDIDALIAQADGALISIPQTAKGDPVLLAFGDALARARHLRSVVYLSTIGVYGDSAGGWVDEDTPAQPEFGARPGTARGRARVAGFWRPVRHPGCSPSARRHLRPGTKCAGADRTQ